MKDDAKWIFFFVSKILCLFLLEIDAYIQTLIFGKILIKRTSRNNMTENLIV